MFDYARKLQLAASDMGRRVGMKVGAGVVGLLALGFLLAALWTFLAYHLDWGSLGASLAIGILFLVVAGILYAMSNSVRHPVPSTDELKREVEARVNLATEAAMDKAKDKAREVVDMAGNRVSSLMDEASERVSAFVDGTEAKVQRFTNTTVGKAARSAGLTPQFFDEVKGFTDKARESRAMPAASILGAFAVGMTIAQRLQAGRHRDDYDEGEYFEDEAWDDEDRAW